MHPVERSLRVWKAGFEAAKDIRIRSDAKGDAVHDTGKSQTRFRQNVDVCPHTRQDVLEFTFAEVTDHPPGPRVNQSEYLLPHMGVGPFGKVEICYERIERRVDPAVSEVISGGFHGRRSRAALICKRIKRGDSVLGLLVIGLALVDSGFGPFVLR
jgi:hypothetical protein